MPRTLERDALPALARGFALLGSGGGGSPWILDLALRESPVWPVVLHDVADLDPATPCMALAYAGATMLLDERLPDEAPFAPAITALERWLGHRVPAICSLEAGGMNGLACLPLARERQWVDADLMGRALPDFDQLSLAVDGVPGLVAVGPTGAGGVAVIDGARADDVEAVLRAAITCAGGSAAVVVGGFTVGDLIEHGLIGTHARAQSLGERYLAEPDAGIASRADAIGARVLGAGRITEVLPDPLDLRVTAIEVRTAEGDTVRLVARSELLACMRNGVVEAASPTIVLAVDERTHEVLQVQELTAGRHIAVLSLPGPDWWCGTPERHARVSPSHYGLTALEERR
ncbi:DUF917 family protein [Microbacteriaceae bacterium 4G12]